MSKIIRQENYRVVIEPVTIWGDKSCKYDHQTCTNIFEQVKRHIDDIENVLIKWDTVETCSYCGGGWEVNEDENDDTWGLGEPVCCEKAQKECKKTKTMCKRVDMAAFANMAKGLLGG